jgi:hypothetical protein
VIIQSATLMAARRFNGVDETFAAPQIVPRSMWSCTGVSGSSSGDSSNVDKRSSRIIKRTPEGINNQVIAGGLKDGFRRFFEV